jgi:hypothetical protein
LAVGITAPRRGRRLAEYRQTSPTALPLVTNQRWSLDSVSDQLTNDRIFNKGLTESTGLWDVIGDMTPMT